jgi:hypothetical protein
VTRTQARAPRRNCLAIKVRAATTAHERTGGKNVWDGHAPPANQARFPVVATCVGRHGSEVEGSQLAKPQHFGYVSAGRFGRGVASWRAMTRTKEKP